MKTIKTLTIAIASLGFLAAPMTASATFYTDNTVETRIKKSDLKTDIGIQKVYRQLEQTAKSKCNVTGQTILANQRSSNLCKAGLLDDFVKNINHERLSQFHKNAKSG